MAEQRPVDIPQEAIIPDLEAQDAAEQARAFIGDVAPHLGRMFGTDLHITVGNGWATNMKTGNVTVDPTFFTEKGYTPDMSAYATLHEVVAHLREVQIEPALTARVMRFSGKGKAESVFHNVLADVAGNNRIHAALPRMADVAHELYDTKLFPTIDRETGQPVNYANTREFPRHLQFLYKIIRQEMIPDSQTAVQPEVDEAIDRLRDYQGQGDVIAYSTEAPKRRGEQLSATDRFNTWTTIIYPEYQKLIELDKQDPEAGADAKSDPESGEGEGQSGESQHGQQSESSDGQSQPGNGQFDNAYKSYEQNHHPEPLSHEEQEKVAEDAKQKAYERPQNINPQRAHDQQLREETGYGLREHQAYQADVAENSEAIARMRDIYRSVINERIALKRGLSRTTYSEGAILDPNRLPQTIIDIKSGVHEPEAYQQYERRKGETTAVGKTDYIFVFDCSGSMFQGETGKQPADAAAQSALILVEGLSAMQRDIEAAEAEYDMDLELDIRTALYTFGSSAECVKPLGNTLSDKDRLAIVHKIKQGRGSTADFLALEAIADIPLESDRQRIVVVVTDGGSDNDAQSRAAQNRLKQQGIHVYGVSINSDKAAELYAPNAKRIDDAKQLPDALEVFIEGTLL